ncbi:hypothetical protein CC2G_012055 [Coprinopsis cinerea AmutBmut pab1-1]|nr:hypothetical protein CC2G_012055 [Coprinopsis cinerea AmutBmut pab1-1]
MSCLTSDGLQTVAVQKACGAHEARILASIRNATFGHVERLFRKLERKALTLASAGALDMQLGTGDRSSRDDWTKCKWQVERTCASIGLHQHNSGHLRSPTVLKRKYDINSFDFWLFTYCLFTESHSNRSERRADPFWTHDLFVGLRSLQKRNARLSYFGPSSCDIIPNGHRRREWGTESKAYATMSLLLGFPLRIPVSSSLASRLSRAKDLRMP